MPSDLTPEREAQARGFACKGNFAQELAWDLLQEIDRLRAQIAALEAAVQLVNPYEDARCTHPDRSSPDHVHTHACVEAAAQQKGSGE